MPYIKDRSQLDPLIDNLSDRIHDPGTANYVITSLLLKSFDPQRYADHNEVVGILECVKLEFYRRATVPYEKKKIKENGDVYPNRKRVSSTSLPASLRDDFEAAIGFISSVLNQTQAAARLGVSASLLSQWKNGLCKPQTYHYDAVKQLQKELQCEST